MEPERLYHLMASWDQPVPPLVSCLGKRFAQEYRTPNVPFVENLVTLLLLLNMQELIFSCHNIASLRHFTTLGLQSCASEGSERGESSGGDCPADVAEHSEAAPVASGIRALTRIGDLSSRCRGGKTTLSCSPTAAHVFSCASSFVPKQKSWTHV